MGRKKESYDPVVLERLAIIVEELIGDRTREEFSALTKLSKGTLFHVLEEMYVPTLGTLKLLADHMGILIEELVARIHDRPIGQFDIDVASMPLPVLLIRIKSASRVELSAMLKAGFERLESIDKENKKLYDPIVQKRISVLVDRLMGNRTREEFQKETGISKGTLFYIQEERFTPTLLTLNLVSDHMGILIEELVALIHGRRVGRVDMDKASMELLELLTRIKNASRKELSAMLKAIAEQLELEEEALPG